MKNIIRKNKSNAHFLEHTRRFHGPSYRNAQAWKIACDIEVMVMLVDAVSHAHRYYCRNGQAHDQDPLAREIIRLAGQMQHLRHFNQEYPHCQYHPYVSLFMDCAYRHLYEQGRFIFDHPYGSFYGHHWQFKVFIDTLRSELRTQSMVLRVKAFVQQAYDDRKMARRAFKKQSKHSLLVLDLLDVIPKDIDQMQQNLTTWISLVDKNQFAVKAYLVKTCSDGLQDWRHVVVLWLVSLLDTIPKRKECAHHLIQIWQQANPSNRADLIFSHSVGPYDSSTPGLTLAPAQEHILDYLESPSSFIKTVLPQADGVPLIRYGELQADSQG